MSIARLLNVVDSDDIRMVKREDGARLLLKALHAWPVCQEGGGQELERHFAIRSEVESNHPRRGWVTTQDL